MRSWRITAMFAGILAVYCATITRAHAVNDVISTSLASWRIATTGSPWLEGVNYAAMTGRSDVWVAVASNGHTVSFRTPGPIAAGVPGYLVARVLGFDGWSLVPGGIVAAILTVLALALMYGALRSVLMTRAALCVVAAAALATPLWSVSADAMWTHPVTVLGIAGMAWGCVRERWWLVGLFGGVAIWGRLHTALIVALLGLLLAWSRRSPRIALTVGAVSASFMGLSVIWSHWFYGTWGLAGGYSVGGYTSNAAGTSEGWTHLLTNQLGLWVAPDRGILVWTPVLLLLVPALVRSWSELPDWSRWLLIGGVGYTLVQGQLNAFGGGSGFYGYRLTLELLVSSMPAFAFSVARAGTFARALTGPLIGLQFGAFALGAAGQGAILNEDHLWTENAYAYAVAHYPVLISWVVLTVFLGWAAGKVLAARLSAAEPAQA